jgi:hypothetical protein
MRRATRAWNARVTSGKARERARGMMDVDAGAVRELANWGSARTARGRGDAGTLDAMARLTKRVIDARVELARCVQHGGGGEKDGVDEGV